MVKRILPFITKYKLLHILFWGLKFITLAHELIIRNPSHVFLAYSDAAVVIFFQIVVVYFVALVLLKKFFFQQKYLRFALITVGTMLLATWLSVWINDHITRWFFIPDYNTRYFIVGFGCLVDIIIITILFIIVYLSWHYYEEDKRNKETAFQQMEAELNFLKAQLNPHFVFNTMNSIYVLMNENLAIAKETLLKFSSLLRYQLYDDNTRYTSIEKELGFISDFIDLEKVRHGEKIDVIFLRHPVQHELMIAPLLLIPFVENAFKHIAIFPGTKSQVFIEFRLNNHQLSFRVENSYTEKKEKRTTVGGLGLQNVKRRLELLYPQRHQLTREIKDGKYITQLNILLHENPMTYVR